MSIKKYHLKCLDECKGRTLKGGYMYGYPYGYFQNNVLVQPYQIGITPLQLRLKMQERKEPHTLVPSSVDETLLSSIASEDGNATIPFMNGSTTIVPRSVMKTGKLKNPNDDLVIRKVTHHLPVGMEPGSYFDVVNRMHSASLSVLPMSYFGVSPFGTEPRPAHGEKEVDGKTFTGAGIMLFEQAGENIILFRSRETNRFEELGGKLGKDDVNSQPTDELVLSSVAKREAYEESGCYIDFDQNILSRNVHVDVEKDSKYYRCYITKIPSFDIKLLTKNFEIIQNDPKYTKASYAEMTGVARFDVNALKKAVLESKSDNNVSCLNLDKEKCYLRDRTAKILRSIWSDGDYKHIGDGLETMETSAAETKKFENGLSSLKIV